MLELTIKGNSPAELFTQITGLYGMLHAGRLAAPPTTDIPIGSPTVTGVSTSAEARANLAPQTDAPVAEKVDPPRKPGRPKKAPETIDLKANLEQSIAETPAAEPAPAPAPEPVVEKLDREGVQRKFLELLNDVREATKDDTKLAEVKNAVFARLNPPLAEPKMKNVPDERLPELLAAVNAERATRFPEV